MNATYHYKISKNKNKNLAIILWGIRYQNKFVRSTYCARLGSFYLVEKKKENDKRDKSMTNL